MTRQPGTTRPDNNVNTSEHTTEELLQYYARTHDPQVRERLIIQHLSLVTRLARRYSPLDKDIDDLIQVGYIGLMNAIDRYDPSKGVLFTTYAIPTIAGEMLRYLRDKSNIVRIPRQLQELRSIARRLNDQLTQQLGRQPSRAELAAALGVDEDELQAAQSYLNLVSLDRELTNDDAEDRGGAVMEYLGREDEEMQRLTDRAMLDRALSELTPRERAILYLYFVEELPQIEIAERLGISQMHVSRLQRQAITRMREALESQDEERR